MIFSILILLKSEHFESVKHFFSELFNAQALTFSNIIENNIFSNITIEELAFICNKSLSSFKREFKYLYHDTPARFIKNRRLEHAARLLENTTDTITDIAFESGFQDISTFSDAFQQKYKLSPTKYRLAQSRKKED